MPNASAVPSQSAPTNRIIASLGFVEGLARRVAAAMPHSIDVGDLVQDGMIGLIDAAERFDEARGIRFQTFAERRIRGAMIDALRREAWPRGVRRVRRQIEAAREALRRELGAEPSLADLAARVGTDEARLGRTIVRINTIEATSPLAKTDQLDPSWLPPVLLPPEQPSPDTAYAATETRGRIRRALGTLPARERKVITLYYFQEATMKQIGTSIGVNESRVSQLHARAIERLKKALVAEAGPHAAPQAALVDFEKCRRALAQAKPAAAVAEPVSAESDRGVLLSYPTTSRAVRTRSTRRKGLGSQRHPDSVRKRSASVPTTSPVAKMTRRARVGDVAAIAR